MTRENLTPYQTFVAQVACSECGAPVGSLCRYPGKTLLANAAHVHLSRVALAARRRSGQPGQSRQSGQSPGRHMSKRTSTTLDDLARDEIVYLPLTSIEPDPEQPRLEVDDELADSIRQHGVLRFRCGRIRAALTTGT